jgi:hypothetical protein
MRQVAYSAEILRATSLSRGPEPIAGPEEPEAKPDDYPTKLVKYVPAETVAFVAFASAVALSTLLSWLVVAIALVGSVLYIATRGRQPWYSHFLTLLAAILWIIGTTRYGEELLGLSYASSRILLAMGVFLIPAIDELLTRWYQRRMSA